MCDFNVIAGYSNIPLRVKFVTMVPYRVAQADHDHALHYGLHGSRLCKACRRSLESANHLDGWPSLVYGTGLENRRGGNSTGGSNPSPSARYRGNHASPDAAKTASILVRDRQLPAKHGVALRDVQEFVAGARQNAACQRIGFNRLGEYAA